jgi:hypothetical protein
LQGLTSVLSVCKAGPTNEGNFEPAVDTLAILTEKFQALRSTVNNLQTAFAGIQAGQQGKDGATGPQGLKVYRSSGAKAVKVCKAMVL